MCFRECAKPINEQQEASKRQKEEQFLRVVGQDPSAELPHASPHEGDHQVVEPHHLSLAVLGCVRCKITDDHDVEQHIAARTQACAKGKEVVGKGFGGEQSSRCSTHTTCKQGSDGDALLLMRADLFSEVRTDDKGRAGQHDGN